MFVQLHITFPAQHLTLQKIYHARKTKQTIKTPVEEHLPTGSGTSGHEASVLIMDVSLTTV